MIKIVKKLVNKHTDDQVGLDLVNVDVYDKHGKITISVVYKDRKVKGSKADWIDQGQDLAKELSHDPGSGYELALGIPFELESANNRSFIITEM